MNDFQACFQSIGISVEPMTESGLKGLCKTSQRFLTYFPSAAKRFKKKSDFLIADAIDWPAWLPLQSLKKSPGYEG